MWHRSIGPQASSSEKRSVASRAAFDHHPYHTSFRFAFLCCVAGLAMLLLLQEKLCTARRNTSPPSTRGAHTRHSPHLFCRAHRGKVRQCFCALNRTERAQGINSQRGGREQKDHQRPYTGTRKRQVVVQRESRAVGDAARQHRCSL